MNLADLTSFLVVITGFISGVIASASVDAPWWVVAICGIMGLSVGILMAWPISKAAYKLLGLESAGGFIAYITLPLIAIIGVGGIVIAGTVLILNLLGYTGKESSHADTFKTNGHNKPAHRTAYLLVVPNAS